MEEIAKQLQETNRLLMLIAESLQRMEKPPVYIIPISEALESKDLDDIEDIFRPTTIPSWDVRERR